MAEGEFYEIPNELLKSLDCSICRERFIDPKIIDCNHVFCLHCLQEYIDSQRPYRNFPPCPICRKPLIVPGRGVSAYQTQTFYADVIQCLESQAAGTFRCRSCVKIIARKCSKRCRHCKELVCSICIDERKHTCCKASGSNDDQISNLAHRTAKCSIHSNEKLVNYCSECKAAICKQCRDTNHVNHEIQSLHSAAINAKKEMLAVQAKLEHYKGEIQSASDDLQDLLKDFTEKVASTKDQIETEFENIVLRINEKKAKLLGKLNDIATRTKKRFETEMEEVQTKDVRAKTLDEFANNLIQYGSDSEAVKFEKNILRNWDELNEEEMHRFGKGFRLELQFQLKEKVLELLRGDTGNLTVSQYLSPWSKRKTLDSVLQEGTSLRHLELTVGNPSWQSFPSKRSNVYLNMVDPHYKFGASKLCPSTGKIAAAWIKIKSVEKSPSFAGKISQQFGSRPNSAEKTSPLKSFSASLDVDVFNKTEKEPHVITLNNIPDTIEVRLALNEDGCLQVALYPGTVVLNENLRRGTIRKLTTEDDCIYVKTLQHLGDSLESGELRKIDILSLSPPDSKNILFEVTRTGYLAVHHPSFPVVFIYSPSGEKRATKCASKDTEIVGLCESNNDGIFIISVRGRELFCEEYRADCTIKYSVCVKSSVTSNTLRPELKSACFDMRENVVLHFRKDGLDHLAVICPADGKEEVLCKPDMFHRVDQMALLPYGRICLFDQTEYVLMTLQYLQ